MNNLVLTFNIVAPLVIYMLLGAGLKKIDLFTAEFVGKLNKFIVNAVLPCSIFSNVCNADLSGFGSSGFMLYAVLGNAAAFFVLVLAGLAAKMEKPRLGSFVQGCCRGNGVIFGIPLCIAVFGEGCTAEMALVLAGLVPFYNIFHIGLLQICGMKQKFSLKPVLKGLAKNGILWGVIAGLAFNVLGLSLPTFMMTCVKGLGGCVTPLGFLMAGASFTFSGVREDRRAIAAAVIIKLVILPGICMIYPILAGWDGHVLLAMLISFAAPTALSSYPQARAMGCDGQLSSEIVAFTTVLSMLTIFLWIFCFKQFGLM